MREFRVICCEVWPRGTVYLNLENVVSIEAGAMDGRSDPDGVYECCIVHLRGAASVQVRGRAPEIVIEMARIAAGPAQYQAAKIGPPSSIEAGGSDDE